jgi:hypothetical protein
MAILNWWRRFVDGEISNNWYRKEEYLCLK